MAGACFFALRSGWGRLEKVLEARFRSCQWTFMVWYLRTICHCAWEVASAIVIQFL